MIDAGSGMKLQAHEADAEADELRPEDGCRGIKLNEVLRSGE